MVVAENMTGCAMYELVRCKISVGSAQAELFNRSVLVMITWLGRSSGSKEIRQLYKCTKRQV